VGNVNICLSTKPVKISLGKLRQKGGTVDTRRQTLGKKTERSQHLQNKKKKQAEGGKRKKKRKLNA